MTEKSNERAGTATTGHEWDGIQELDTPLPRWWLWTFYACILFAIVWTIAYPAWPRLSGSATPGLLGYSSRAAVAADIAHYNGKNAALEAKLVAADLAEVTSDVGLANFATQGGAAIFRTRCATCHGAGAGGARGYPNLVDDDWLWGGSVEDVYQTVSHGVRFDKDEDTRTSEMPAFGDILEGPEIAQLAQYVLSISGQDHDAGAAGKGEALFGDNCAICHGEGGTGGREFGAPNLTDAIWLYGGDADTITETITKARYGVMPAWAGQLSESQIRQVAIWVHQQGGGE
ncbi:MAG: cytochrome-c oxidase, cbb3-type subunit III [Paracoccaceae bacterium]